MQTVNISEFRSNLLNYLKKAQDGHKITVTSHGKKLAVIGPSIDEKKQAKVKLKQLSKSAVINDTISPINEQWKALL